MRVHNGSCLGVLVGLTGLAAAPAGAGVFSFADFSDTSRLALVGDSYQSGASLRLYDSGKSLMGAAWYAEPVRVDAFTTTFSFRTSDADHWGGADGFGFIIQSLGTGLETWEFGPGAGAVAVEFDFYKNPRDVSGNSLEVWGDGASPIDGDTSLVSVDLATLGVNMKDGLAHQVTIAYDGAMLHVAIDGVTVVEDLAVGLGSARGLDGTAWVGFSGRTGAAHLALDMLDWGFESIPAPGTIALLGLAGLVVGRRSR